MIQNDLTHRERALRLVQDRGIVRARDFTAAGIPLVYLKRLCDSGDIFRLSRGLYQDPNRLGEHAAHDLAEAARRVPNGVISLISALHYHQLTTQLPHAVWMTIPHKARTPNAQGLRLEFIRATGEVMSAGIEHISIEGVLVPIFCPAKTVADCFKHRRIVGEDVAVEALKDAIRQRKATPSELMRFAAINRVAERVALYLRALQ